MNIDDWEAVWKSSPDAYLLLNLDLSIVAVSDAYLSITHAPSEIIGMNYINFVPHSEDDPFQGVQRSKDSFEFVIKNKIPHVMNLIRNDVPSTEGKIVEQYWTVVNSPVIINGELKYLLHRLENVTDLVRVQNSIDIIAKTIHGVGDGLQGVKSILPLPPSNTRLHRPFGE